MVLSAISEAEVAGDGAMQLTEQQVLDVVIREAKKRREAEEAYTAAGRTELADKERSESAVLAEYLPQQLSAEEVSAIVAAAIAQTGAAELGQRGIGKVMGAVTPANQGQGRRRRGRRRGPTSTGWIRLRRASGARGRQAQGYGSAFSFSCVPPPPSSWLAFFSAAAAAGSRPLEIVL